MQFLTALILILYWQTILIILLGIGRPPGQMDPKAFLLQKFNARAQERVSCGYLISIMLDSSVINLYVQDNLILIRIPKPVNRTFFFLGG